MLLGTCSFVEQLKQNIFGMKSIWKGALSFGLVNIPVQLFSATVAHNLDLDMLDSKDHSHIKYQRINETTGKVVPWEQIVKGYMLEDEYVILEEADFEEAMPKKSKTIEIEEFVDEKEISSIYFDTPYYLVPDKGNSKAYMLLLKALEKSGKVGIARFVMRTSENLAIVRPNTDVMVLNKIRFADEVRSAEDLALPDNPTFSKMEMDTALTLIKQYSVKFEPSKFKNEYKDELMRIIREKAKGKRPTIKKIKVAKTPEKDLLSQLKASLESSKQKAS